MQRRSDPERRMRGLTRTVGSGAGAALAMSLIMLAAPASALVPAGAFPHATWTPSVSYSTAGCAAARTSHASWSSVSGVGHWKGDAWAHICPSGSGGPATYSSSGTSGSISISAPLTFPGGTGGVNVTWNISVAEFVQASVPTLGSCPKTVTSYPYNAGYSWINTTIVSRDCSDSAIASLYASVYVLDSTNGSYYQSTNYWNGLAVSAGHSVYSTTTITTYSNSTYWVDNSTSTYSTTYGHTPSARFLGTVMPTWYVNGTFSPTDKYFVVTYISGYDSAGVYGWVRANAQAHINALTGANALTLEPFSIW